MNIIMTLNSRISIWGATLTFSCRVKKKKKTLSKAFQRWNTNACRKARLKITFWLMVNKINAKIRQDWPRVDKIGHNSLSDKVIRLFPCIFLITFRGSAACLAVRDSTCTWARQCDLPHRHSVILGEENNKEIMKVFKVVCRLYRQCF